jgi:hypothetical protein
MASESDARYTFQCPEDGRTTYIYSRAFYDRCAPGVTLRMSERPVCHKPHVFTKQDLVRPDDRRKPT